MNMDQSAVIQWTAIIALLLFIWNVSRKSKNVMKKNNDSMLLETPINRRMTVKGNEPTL